MRHAARRLAGPFLLVVFAAAMGQAPDAQARSRRPVVSEAPLPAPRPADLTPPSQAPPLPAPLPPPRPADLAPQPLVPQIPLASPEAEAQCAGVLASGVLAGERRPAFAESPDCGIETPVQLDAVILKDGRRVALTPPALLNCAMAGALADWLREEGAGLLEERAGAIKLLTVGGGYQCRRRNGGDTGKISEHARGDALDLMGVQWVHGDVMAFTDPAMDLALATNLRASLCDRFSTVLGPASDGFHENHVHIDIEKRSNGAKLCQWDLK
jgi:hypothetical protein